MNAMPQIILSPAGDELVVIPKAEYEALVARAEDIDEDAADLAVALERKAALAAGHDVVLPTEVSAAMLKGDRFLKALRKWRGVTQADLARKADLTQGYLSEIERGDKIGAPESLERIAAALDVPPSWLIDRG